MLLLFFFFFMIRRPPRSTLFPYTTLSDLYYEGTSGVPIDYVTNGDLNGDLLNNNDLIYIPRNALDQNEILIGSVARDRKSTRLNSSHSQISYAVFCLKKKKKKNKQKHLQN